MGLGFLLFCVWLVNSLFLCTLSPPALIKTGSISVTSAVIDLIRSLLDYQLQLLISVVDPASFIVTIH